MSGKPQLDILTDQILLLVDYITKIKQELAAIKHPKSSVDHFNTVSEQLNTIVQTTEDATNTIMESAEDILNQVDDLGTKIKYSEADNSFNAIVDSTNKIFESCSFHDLTGQRISKIVRIMTRLENTLDSLVEIVGPKGLEEMPVNDDETIEDVIGMKDGSIAMHGPQVTGQEVSQNDIDALFGGGGSTAEASQGDIDALFDTPAPAKEQSQDDIDAMFDTPDPAPAPPSTPSPAPAADPAPKKVAAPAAMPSGGDVSQDDIDKLFG